jgi:Phospholipase C
LSAYFVLSLLQNLKGLNRLMPTLTRRKLLQAAAIGSAYTLLPDSIRQALAIPANNRTGTLMDVEHVVILMQENRSFDHYFGIFPGVRGFSDRFTLQRTLSCQPNGGWYDFKLREHGWVRRVAGRIETGAHSISDPLMGKRG